MTQPLERERVTKREWLEDARSLERVCPRPVRLSATSPRRKDSGGCGGGDPDVPGERVAGGWARERQANHHRRLRRDRGPARGRRDAGDRRVAADDGDEGGSRADAPDPAAGGVRKGPPGASGGARPGPDQSPVGTCGRAQRHRPLPAQRWILAGRPAAPQRRPALRAQPPVSAGRAPWRPPCGGRTLLRSRPPPSAARAPAGPSRRRHVAQAAGGSRGQPRAAELRGAR